jgi:hypothetical protein
MLGTNFGLCENDILDINIFGNSDITFNVHLTVKYFVCKLYLFIFDKIVNVKHPQFPLSPPFLSLIFKQHTFLSIWFGLYIVPDKFPNQIKIIHLFSTVPECNAPVSDGKAWFLWGDN